MQYLKIQMNSEIRTLTGDISFVLICGVCVCLVVFFSFQMDLPTIMIYKIKHFHCCLCYVDYFSVDYSWCYGICLLKFGLYSGVNNLYVD